MKYELVQGTKVVSAADNGHFILRAGQMFNGLEKNAIPDVDIEIEDGIIKAIEKRGSFEGSNLPVEDFSDCFVMPGLIDAHTHFSGRKTPDPYKRYIEPNDIRVIRATRHAEIILSLGYTSIRDPGGNSVSVGIREAAALGLTHAPRLVTSIEYLSPTDGHGDWPVMPYEMVRALHMRSCMVDGVDECIKAIRYLSREKADFTKIVISSGSMGQNYETMQFKNNFSRRELEAMVEETHDHGRIIAAHTVGNEGVRRALDVGIDSLEHCFFNFEKEPELLDRMVEKKTMVVPTLSIIHWQGENEEQHGRIEKAKSFYRNVEKHGKFVKAAFEAGLCVACGTDETGTRGTGRCPEEYGRMAAAGVPNYGILWGATSRAAKVACIDHKTGSLKKGMSADIIVLKKDPLKDISLLQDKNNLEYVIQGKQ